MRLQMAQPRTHSYEASRMKIFRGLHTIAALSFDLDYTLYTNAPVIAAAEVAMLTSLQCNKPQLTQNNMTYWQLQRQLVVAQRPELRQCSK